MTTDDRAVYIAHDTKLGELHGEWFTARLRLTSALNDLDAMHRWNMNGTKIAAADAKVVEAREAVNAAEDAVFEHEKAYTGWPRFFLVKNVNGHIHRTMGCATCFDTTRFAALPDLSGLTDAEAVAEHGEILCTVCFPDAPVAWTNGVSKATKAERDVRAAAKAERAAKKAAKAIRADGNPVRVAGDRIETIAAAKAWLTDAAWWNTHMAARDGAGATHPSYPTGAALTVATALADRTGEPVEAVIEAAVKRAAKRK